jgi:hypothetical protein
MSAAEMLAGAAPERTPDWHSIEWRKVWRTVRRLQARIEGSRHPHSEAVIFGLESIYLYALMAASRCLRRVCTHKQRQMGVFC